MNLYNHYGRFSKRACKIIIELWKEGVDLGSVTLANGKTFPADITWHEDCFELAGFFYTNNLRAPNAPNQDIVRIEKADLVAMRYREKHLMPAYLEMYYTVEITSCAKVGFCTWLGKDDDIERLHNGFVQAEFLGMPELRGIYRLPQKGCTHQI